MRKIFIDTLIELAEQDERIILLTGDLGYTVLEPFQQKFPERFINAGVAEQNMVGMSVGLAESGYLPFIYSIAPFALFRPYEFIRNGGAHQHLPLRIVGIGGGFAYGTAGPSHYALEDYAVTRVLPDFLTLVPADSPQTATMLRASYDRLETIYYRIDKNDKLVIPELIGRFNFNQPEIISEGSDVLLVTTGSISTATLAAAKLLKDDGIMATTAVVSTLNPAPAQALKELIEKFKLVISVEEHYVTGGLGSLVAEVIADHGLGTRLIRMGVKRGVDGISGTEDFLRTYHGLTKENIVQTVTTATSMTARAY